MQVVPLSDSLGAEIRGVDLRKLSDAEFAQIHDAWLEHLVLRFRGQHLSDDDLQAFSARFGPLEKVPLGRLREKLSPEQFRKLGLENLYVTSISNIVEDGVPLGGLGSGEAAWHSDMSYQEDPATGSILYAVEVPEHGGDTQFANQYAAYDALPDALRSRIENLTLKHDAVHTSVGKRRPGFDEFESPEDVPGAIHPIVRPHGETGRPALYLGRRDWAFVPGLPIAEGEALLDELWRYAAPDENVLTQKWQVGDVVVWDNRAVLHRRDELDPNERRMMRRCQVLASGAS
jgi:taurine dioxygenase